MFESIMQVGSLMMSNKWAAGRVPPLDLTEHSLNPRETERRWHLNSNHQQSAVAGLMDHHHSRKHTIYPDQFETRYQQQTTLNGQHSQSSNLKFDFVLGADGLPIDPRDWTRADVWSWLTNLALSEGLMQPNADLSQKFPMNGKALCLMSLDMYLARVPHGGKMLYRDFRLRLARAMSL